MSRPRVSRLLAGVLALTSATQAVAAPACAPALAVEEVRFSEVRPPGQARIWFALVSVDASACAPESSGHFDVVFSRLKENGPDLEFRERFVWTAPAVRVAVDFWPDEAVGDYRVDAVTPCRCPS